ncbi:MAG: PAS domain-containing protein [Arcobacteraceae bacterium]|nr:PAS domain-containing protein [Arcobacteraceae bacterium]
MNINTKLNLVNLKESLNCVSESVIVSSLSGDIVIINESAIKKLGLSASYQNNRNIMDFIPEDQKWKIEQAIKSNNSEYYEIELRREDDNSFPAIVSGKTIFIDEIGYRVSTILDVTSLKETEEKLLSKTKEQLKTLKNHIVKKVSQNAQDTNILKSKFDEESKNYSDDIKKLKNKILDDNKVIEILSKKIDILDKKNKELKQKILKIAKESFSFEDLLKLEIARAGSLNTKFSLVLISIDNFIEIFNSPLYRTKTDIIINATLRYFKNTLRNYDMVQYIDNGMFYIVLTNTPNFNISKMINNLIQPRILLDKLELNFTGGMSHFHQKDNVESLIYRCMKDHSEHQERKK